MTALALLLLVASFCSGAAAAEAADRHHLGWAAVWFLLGVGQAAAGVNLL